MKLNKKYIAVIAFCGWATIANAQLKDSIASKRLPSINVLKHPTAGTLQRLDDVHDHVIYAAKKNEVIEIDNAQADVATNNSRQVFAKVPGVSIWENDGSGIQTSIAVRGLSPNRNWEFNVRQNGYDISSESFGYPETYYTPPMEALQKIEIVRGAASLQYGPQFGGLLNYEIKKGHPSKKINIETQQTMGSYGMFNTYNAIGGTVKKLTYYAYLHHRRADGWRENSFYKTLSGHASIQYQWTKKLALEAEYSSMDYLSQQPGGLTDIQFTANAQQSSRARNWFSAPFNVGALILKYKANEKIQLQLKTFVLAAERNSIGFTKAINIQDTINTSTNSFAARQIDRDAYFNMGAEARATARYQLFKKEQVIAGGVRIYDGATDRNQLGIGDEKSNFNLDMVEAKYGRALQFNTRNYAAFAEQIFYVSSKFKVVPGLRYEYLQNAQQGYANATLTVPAESRQRQQLLYGLGAEYKASTTTNIYSNFAKAYRPITFSELTPLATTDSLDNNLKDASGFNFDLGYRGTLKNYLTFDIGVFYLWYDNRIGTVAANGKNLRTNIGTSISKGLESYVELDILKLMKSQLKYGSLHVYSSNSFIDAYYSRWDNPAIANDPAKAIVKKRLENAPTFTHRMGINYNNKGFSISLQGSKVSDVFTDAANTISSNATATIGKINGYQLLDINTQYKWKKYNLKLAINNVTDAIYATRRAGGYPGPGLLPGIGRNMSIGIGANL